jgi:hypothetical protein
MIVSSVLLVEASIAYSGMRSQEYAEKMFSLIIQGREIKRS